jgi:hypothetical protein
MAGGAQTLRDALLPAVDAIRGIPGQLGLRLYTVQVFQRIWSGPRVGLGTNFDVATGVKVDLGIYQTKVTQLTQRDVVASGGFYSDQDLQVGPITPPFAGSFADNDAISVFDPTLVTAPTEILFNISGPGMPAGGGWFKKISQDVSKSFRYTFIVRRTAEIP